MIPGREIEFRQLRVASPSSVASRAQKAPPDFGRALASDRSAHDDAIIPIEIAFLEDYGVDRRTLRQACEIAERHGVSPEAALLDEGMIGEEQFYLALADLLRTPYYAGEPPVDPAADPRFAISSGFVALRGNAWDCAPQWRRAARRFGFCWKARPSGEKRRRSPSVRASA